MKRPVSQASIAFAASALLLATSVVYMVLAQVPEYAEAMPFPVPVHLGILAVVFLGFWELGRLRKTGLGGDVNPLAIPGWLVAVFAACIVLALPYSILWEKPPRYNFGTEAPDGTAVGHRQTFERDGRYYLELNRRMRVEIPREEYLADQGQAKAWFARIWVAFSCIALGFWHYLGRRRRAVSSSFDEARALLRTLAPGSTPRTPSSARTP